jgi:hypothetical protein
VNPCLGVRLLNLPLVYHPYAHLQDKRRLQTPIKHKQQTKIMCFCCFVSLVFIVSGVWVWCVAVWFCCFVDACPTCRQACFLETCFYLSRLSGVGRASFRVSGGRKEGVGGAGPAFGGTPLPSADGWASAPRAINYTTQNYLSL